MSTPNRHELAKTVGNLKGEVSHLKSELANIIERVSKLEESQRQPPKVTTKKPTKPKWKQ